MANQKEIASIVSAVLSALESKPATTKKKATKKAKASKKADKFPAWAVDLRKSYNKRMAHLNKHQRRSIVSTGNKGDNITIQKPVYADGQFQKLQAVSFVAKGKGIVLEVNHTSRGFKETKWVYY